MSIADAEAQVRELRTEALELAFDGDQTAAQFAFNQAVGLEQLLAEARRAELPIQISEK